eukprot:TRINITY_DN9359_c0_g1_i1.p1 TRINITY_DN9359_c0_g1~~TRINITY_DN9359_c0_g1_i1.p1  ORF type:complete len:273 (-),score=-14.85 TRINITY_DN9359_c0_g1_i1:93-911(-)
MFFFLRYQVRIRLQSQYFSQILGIGGDVIVIQKEYVIVAYCFLIILLYLQFNLYVQRQIIPCEMCTIFININKLIIKQFVQTCWINYVRVAFKICVVIIHNQICSINAEIIYEHVNLYRLFVVIYKDTSNYSRLLFLLCSLLINSVQLNCSFLNLKTTQKNQKVGNYGDLVLKKMSAPKKNIFIFISVSQVQRERKISLISLKLSLKVSDKQRREFQCKRTICVKQFQCMWELVFRKKSVCEQCVISCIQCMGYWERQLSVLRYYFFLFVFC